MPDSAWLGCRCCMQWICGGSSWNHPPAAAYRHCTPVAAAHFADPAVVWSSRLPCIRLPLVARCTQRRLRNGVRTRSTRSECGTPYPGGPHVHAGAGSALAVAACTQTSPPSRRTVGGHILSSSKACLSCVLSRLAVALARHAHATPRARFLAHPVGHPGCRQALAIRAASPAGRNADPAVSALDGLAAHAVGSAKAPVIRRISRDPRHGTWRLGATHPPRSQIRLPACCQRPDRAWPGGHVLAARPTINPHALPRGSSAGWGAGCNLAVRGSGTAVGARPTISLLDQLRCAAPWSASLIQYGPARDSASPSLIARVSGSWLGFRGPVPGGCDTSARPFARNRAR